MVWRDGWFGGLPRCGGVRHLGDAPLAEVIVAFCSEDAAISVNNASRLELSGVKMHSPLWV